MPIIEMYLYNVEVKELNTFHFLSGQKTAISKLLAFFKKNIKFDSAGINNVFNSRLKLMKVYPFSFLFMVY